ncbi:MAG TPA: hypothetical protein VGK96_28395 [Candidatus Sulfotelmatobacter sp.]|jgi:hypothetical protein
MSVLGESWKSTVSSILTATMATSAAFLAPPLNALIPAKYVLGLGAVQIIGKIWIGLITQDADKTLAVVPGNPTPQVVPAHPVPDDPAAKPVVSQSASNSSAPKE